MTQYKTFSFFFSQRNYFYYQSERVLFQSMAFHSHTPSRQLWEKPNSASLVTNSSQSFPFSREQAQNPQPLSRTCFSLLRYELFPVLGSPLQLGIFKHSHPKSTIYREKEKIAVAKLLTMHSNMGCNKAELIQNRNQISSVTDRQQQHLEFWLKDLCLMKLNSVNVHQISQ